MTQLVGVLCENREKVVLLSDRMVTTSDGSLAFEHEPKYVFIAANAIVLTAGTVHEPELITNAQAEIKGRGSLQEIAESLSRSYREIRKKRIEHEILQEVGITSFEDFQRKQNLLHEGVVLDLSNRIREYDLGVALLLGGVDDKAHLYRIGEPGTYRSFSELGFCCIGSGDRHAEPVFAFYNFSPRIKESEALSIVFEAKKRAEMAGGVGKETDAWVIEKGGVYEITRGTIQNLEGAHAEQEDLSKLLGEIEVEKSKMEYPKA